jgi:hypothetical protein
MTGGSSSMVEKNNPVSKRQLVVGPYGSDDASNIIHLLVNITFNRDNNKKNRVLDA